MILLGLNCGFGNPTVRPYPSRRSSLETGWVDFPRPKTGIARCFALWPETVAAIRDATANRLRPRDERASVRQLAGLVFVRETPKSHTDLISVQFGRLLKCWAYTAGGSLLHPASRLQNRRGRGP